MPRSLDNEARDNDHRKYTYDIDERVRRFLLKRIENRISPELEVLEIGSHDGYMTEILLDYFHHVSVLEPVKELADFVKSKFGDAVTVENGTIEKNLIEKKFDLVFLVHVLEHLDNPIRELTSIRKLLNDEGFLVVMVPNAEAVSRRIAVKMGIMPRVDSVTEGEALQGHRRTYSITDLISHSISAGYRIEEKGGILFKPLANFQLDLALKAGIISQQYLEALEEIAKEDFTGSSSIFVILV